MRTRDYEWEKDNRLSTQERQTLTTFKKRGKIEDLGQLNRLVSLGYLYKVKTSQNVLNYEININPNKNF